MTRRLQVYETKPFLSYRGSENVLCLYRTAENSFNSSFLIFNSKYDTAGKPVKKWDKRGYEFTFKYDDLQRLTETIVNDICTEKLKYGDDKLQNNIGQIITSYAQDGKTCFEYDFKGNSIKQEKYFAEDYDTPQIDWNDNVDLLNEIFTTETTFDALNRPVTITNPDNSVISYEYDKGGMLQKVSKDATEHITNITYNAKGQRKNIYYGNDTKTRYYYHKKNFRLLRILTTRDGGKDILQDLNYDFDAVGNITQITDNAQDDLYFGNQLIEPVSTFEYDALYRLIKATGREKNALAKPTHEDFPNDLPVPNLDPNAIQTYTHKYEYDALGNMLKMQSIGAGGAGNWTRDYIYDIDPNTNIPTNRLLKHDVLQGNAYTYDAHGNMLTMPHLSNMYWDYQDRLFSATNGTFTSYYNYDAQGNRTRKTVEKGNIIETRYYIGGYEVYREEVNSVLDTERTTLNIADDEKVFVIIDTLTIDNGKILSFPDITIRYQYDNHLGSACLELDENGDIISYEEYHPFGTTSYRAGRSETEVSLKRYKYCGKERDEESGLYYYGMGYYAAWICRFVSVDKIQFKYPELTPYQYASNRPITGVDLDGLEYVNFEIKDTLKENAYKLRDQVGQPPAVVRDTQGAAGAEIRKTSEDVNVAKNVASVQKYNEAVAKANHPTIGAAAPNHYSPQSVQARDAAAMRNEFAKIHGPLAGGGDGFGVGMAGDPFIQGVALGGLIGMTIIELPTLMSVSAEFSAVSGVSDFGAQMFVKQDIMKWNVTQTGTAMLFKTPSLALSFGTALFGSAFEITPENIFDKETPLFKNTFFGNKTLPQLGVETFSGGFSTYFGGQIGIGLGIENTVVNATATGILQFIPNTTSNVISTEVNQKLNKK